MKIAIAQLNPIIGDLDHNAEHILTAVKTAAAAGARIVLTPELSLCGYPPRDLLLRPRFIQAMREALIGLAERVPPDIAVLVGFAEPNQGASDRGEKPLFNSIALIENGQIQQVFHKQLLPTYDVFDEERYFEPGQQVNHFHLALEDGQSVHIGVTICEDLWNDEQFWGQRRYPNNPIASLREVGVDLVVNLSASPFNAQKQQVRESMLKHSATRFNVPILYANQIGANDDLIFDGSSVAISRQGDLVGRACAFRTDLLWLEYDLASADLQANRIQPPIADINEDIWSALVLGVGDYARKCGFTKAVIGLSGGIDSCSILGLATPMQQASVRAYTISFDSDKYDESSIAKEMAEAAGADQVVLNLTGDELYVRARVVSSRRHPNPSEPGEFERAWIQPVRPTGTGE